MNVQMTLPNAVDVLQKNREEVKFNLSVKKK